MGPRTSPRAKDPPMALGDPQVRVRDPRGRGLRTPWGGGAQHPPSAHTPPRRLGPVPPRSSAAGGPEAAPGGGSPLSAPPHPLLRPPLPPRRPLTPSRPAAMAGERRGLRLPRSPLRHPGGWGGRWLGDEDETFLPGPPQGSPGLRSPRGSPISPLRHLRLNRGAAERQRWMRGR